MRARLNQTVFNIIASVLIVLAVMTAIPPSPAVADNAGPYFPDAGVNVPDYFIDWADTGNIISDNNQYASITFTSESQSDYLQGTNFGFNIPTGATINAIVLTIGRYSSEARQRRVRDNRIQLVKDGAVTGDDVGGLTQGPEFNWPTTETAITYHGSTNELWGTTWTPAEINDPDFGAAFAVWSPEALTGYVDYMQISVTYTFNGTTLTATEVSDTYGNMVNLSATISPVLSGKSISFTLNGAPACSATTNTSGVATCPALLKVNYGTYATGVGASFAGDTNYEPSSDTASLTVNQRPIAVTAVADSKTYDGSTASDGAPTLATGSLANGDTASWAQAFDNKNAGSGKTLTPSGSVSDGNDGNNYAITFAPVSTGVITQRPITVTADAKTKAYGEADPELTYSVVPELVPGDSFTGALSRTGDESVGVYSIEQGDLSAGTNYTITFVGASFTITAADQVITINIHAPEHAFKDDTFTVAATSSSGLEVVYSASGGCTNSGTLFTMTSSTQDCIVHYNQTGNNAYNPAREVTETVFAADAPVITLHPVDARVFPGQDAVFTAAASGTPTPTVQWQVSTDKGATFADLPGETSTTLTITAPGSSSNGLRYQAVFTNDFGIATSNPAALYLMMYSNYLPVLMK